MSSCPLRIARRDRKAIGYICAGLARRRGAQQRLGVQILAFLPVQLKMQVRCCGSMARVARQCDRLTRAHFGARRHQRPGQMEIPGHPPVVTDDADLIAAPCRVRHLHDTAVRGNELRADPGTKVNAAMRPPVLEDRMETPAVNRGNQSGRRGYSEAISLRRRTHRAQQGREGHKRNSARTGCPRALSCCLSTDSACPDPRHLAPAAVNAPATAPSSSAVADSLLSATTPASTAIGS